MIGLLRQPKRDGYPADYLFARLRGKRRHLLQVAAGSIDSDRWEKLQADYLSVFESMRPALRKTFAPFFLYFELRSLQMLLRAFVGNDRQMLTRLCRGSMLNQKMLNQLLQCKQYGELLEVVNKWFVKLLRETSLPELYNDGGNRAVEEALVDGLLDQFGNSRQQKDIAAFVADQIDLRNLLSAGRYLRWDLGELSLIEGGSEISRQLIAARGRSGRESMLQIVNRYGGENNDLALLESELLARFSRRMQLAGRDPLGAGLVVDYLWRRYLAFREAGLKFWAGEDVAAWEGLV